MDQSHLNKLHEICRHAVDNWGPDSQMIKCIEECGELIVALSKTLNNSPLLVDAVVDELADVQIMLWQMNIVFGADLVLKRIDYKMGKLHRKLNPESGAI